ncbi:MAG: MoaD/ThiS family protein [Methanospirillum sp.]|nr:MoaD/ThiS family protein [Methanospirillum sp.]
MKLILPDNSERELRADGKTVEEILLAQGIDPLTVIVSRDQEIIPEDTIPDEQDTIRIIRISHGG